MPKRVTLREVAVEANVSYQTVSKVLNRQIRVSKETEARIHEAARNLGYHPDLKARSLRMQRSGLLGYSRASSSPDEPNAILDMFLSSMVDAAGRSGYHVLPFPRSAPGDEIEAYRQLLRTGRVDGFILSSVEFDDPRIAFLLQEHFPFVAFGRSNPEQDIPFVDVDGTQGIAMVVEHLLHLGHRTIALLGWPEGSRVGQDRLAGYSRALNAAGISLREEWIARGEGSAAFGQRATARWLDGDCRPTAIVALDD
ncbi:MAG: LacI family DNA-binding transcriptional regulator, partial [Rudaea sp.]